MLLQYWPPGDAKDPMSALPASVRMTTERSAPPRDLEIRPKQVKAWIEALPLAQSVESARRMSAHLTALNRAKLEVDIRVQILDVYRPFAGVVLEELEAIYAKAALPLGPRAREALTLARAIAFDLAAGYRIAIGEKTGKILAFGAKKHLPALLARAIEYLGIELVASYKSYSPVPSAIWSEMHQLYLFAERQGVATESADAESKVTAADLYSEALLLSLTDPYRLIPGECDQILAVLKPMRGFTTLGQVRPQTRAGGHFLVPCDTDKPPKPMLSASDDAGGPNWRLFDANAIVDKLRARKSAHETGNVSATLSRSVTPDALVLMGKLITLWGDPPKRAHRRDPMETTVAVCVGLKAVGHFVSAQPAGNSAAEGETIRAGITIPLTAVPDDETSKAFPVHEWDVVNHSAGGVKLQRASQSLNPVVVGDVVGIKFINRANWTIGAVRWITQFEEGGMEFGVQFLANLARSVWVQPMNSSNPQAKPGLLLTDDEGADSLLTQPSLFGDMRTFEIEAQGEISTVRATGLIEKTPRFDVFYVSAC
jgi:cyclic-di-GMP-binding protein